MKNPPIKLPLFNRIALIVICSLCGLSGVYGFILNLINASYGVAIVSGVFGAICLLTLFWALTTRNCSTKDFENLMDAPFELPNGKHISVNDSGWLVSRFSKEGVFKADSFAAAAVDLKTNEIHFQDCFYLFEKKFLDDGSAVPYQAIRLDEIESVKVQRILESPNRELSIATNLGVGSVIDSGSNFSELWELLVEKLPAEKTAFRLIPTMKQYLVNLSWVAVLLLFVGVLIFLILPLV